MSAEVDHVLYLAVLNGWAKEAAQRVNDPALSDHARARARTEREYLYAVKVAAAARLAYTGRLTLGMVDTTRAKPAALLVGHSPALGYHAFHLLLPANAWALKLPPAERIPYKPRHRPEAAPGAPHRGMKAEVIAALLALPPLPNATRRAWKLDAVRPGWPALESERANAPGGVPRTHRPKPRP